MLTARSQIKDLVKQANTKVQNISEDFADKLDEKVKEMVLAAVKRAQENQRRTVMGRDL